MLSSKRYSVVDSVALVQQVHQVVAQQLDVGIVDRAAGRRRFGVPGQLVAVAVDDGGTADAGLAWLRRRPADPSDRAPSAPDPARRSPDHPAAARDDAPPRSPNSRAAQANTPAAVPATLAPETRMLVKAHLIPTQFRKLLRLAEDVVEHCRSQPTGEHVLLARVVAAEQPDAGRQLAPPRRDRISACASPPPPGNPQRDLPAEPAQGHDHPDMIGHQPPFGVQPGRAGRPFGRRRGVGRGRAPDRREIRIWLARNPSAASTLVGWFTSPARCSAAYS